MLRGAVLTASGDQFTVRQQSVPVSVFGFVIDGSGTRRRVFGDLIVIFTRFGDRYLTLRMVNPTPKL